MICEQYTRALRRCHLLKRKASTFGIELNIDGALSPTHLILATCIGLIVAGPFRAAWKRTAISPRCLAVVVKAFGATA